MYPLHIVCLNKKKGDLFRFAVPIILLFAILGCHSNADWHFEGDSKKLLLSEKDIPPDWNLATEGIIELPIPDTKNGFVRYSLPTDSFFNNGLISQSVIIFDDVDQAKEYMNADYQLNRDQVEQTAKGRGIQWSEFAPPPRHSYKSPLADEVKELYYPEAIAFSPVGNISYFWARYGNVVSTFITIVEDPETTQITADEANVVPWTDVERMLKRIDQKFADAGKQANQ